MKGLPVHTWVQFLVQISHCIKAEWDFFCYTFCKGGNESKLLHFFSPKKSYT